MLKKSDGTPFIVGAHRTLFKGYLILSALIAKDAKRAAKFGIGPQAAKPNNGKYGPGGTHLPNLLDDFQNFIKKVGPNPRIVKVIGCCCHWGGGPTAKLLWYLESSGGFLPKTKVCVPMDLHQEYPCSE